MRKRKSSTFHSLIDNGDNPNKAASGLQYTTRRWRAKGTITPGINHGLCQGWTTRRDESRETAERAFKSSIVTSTEELGEEMEVEGGCENGWCRMEVRENGGRRKGGGGRGRRKVRRRGDNLYLKVGLMIYLQKSTW